MKAKFILASLGICVSAFLLIAFVLMELNPAMWPLCARMVLAAVCGPTAGCVGVTLYFEGERHGDL